MVSTSKLLPVLICATALLSLESMLSADEALRRPVVIIVRGDKGHIASGLANLPRQAIAGREAYTGEILQTGPEAITFAHCAEKMGQPGVYILAANSSIQLTDGPLAPITPLRRVTGLPICQLPQVDAAPLATTLDEAATQSPQGSSLQSRIAKLPASSQGSLKDHLSLADGLIGGEFALVGRATRAAILEQAGLLDDALTELRTIRGQWTGATWTRDVISRLLKVSISQPDVLSELDSSPGLIVGSTKPNCDGAPGDTYALLIGISKYKSAAIPPLQFADKDAETFQDYLMSDRGGHLAPPGQITLLRNEAASRDGIESAIASLVRGKATCRNTLIIFVAAHGELICTDMAIGVQRSSGVCDSQKTSPYILTFDSDPSEGKVSGLSMAELREVVTSRAAAFGRVLVFIDVCHAGRMGDLPEDTRLHSSDVGDAFAGGTGLLGILMGNSKARSPEDELTYERSTYGHGIFSFYTLLGLNQSLTPTPEGKVYFSDLSAYVTQQVTQVTGRKQRPSVMNPDPQLVAVDHANQSGIRLNVPLDARVPFTDSPRAVGSWQPPLPLASFETAVKEGRLLRGEQANAYELLDELRKSSVPGSYVASATQRLHVALEEKGQEIILKYLKGDQVPQVVSDFDLGERYFRAALDLAPDAGFDESRMLFCRGRAEIFRKRYASAESILDAAISIDPERAYAYNAIGIAYLEQISSQHATFDQAMTAFRKAIRFAPYWAYPRHNLALTYAEAGRFDEAVAEYDQARTLASSYSYLPYNQGLLYQQINAVPEARKAYEDALRLASADCSLSQTCPGMARAYTALGVLYENSGKTSSAEKQYLLALGKDPNSLDARHDLASMWTRLKKQPAKAEGLWLENLRADPSHVPSLTGFSSFLLHAGRPEEALPYYQKLLTFRTNYAPALLDTANILVKSKPRDALAILDAKQDILKNSSEFWLVRARAHVSLHDLAAARTEFEQAALKAGTRRQKHSIRKEAAAT